MSVSDRAIVGRWRARLVVRRALLTAARRRLAYWRRELANARNPDRTDHAQVMVRKRLALVRRRQAQVDQARRVIGRHSRRGPWHAIDVSNNNPSVNMRAVREQGFAGVLLKASEGTEFVDLTFTPRARQARQAGLKVGAYHFLRPAQDLDAQVARFLGATHAVRELAPGQLLLALDVEDAAGLATSQLEALVERFLNGIEQRTKQRPGIYTSSAFMPWRSDHNTWLWVAHYGVPAPTIPHAWHDWTAWQFSDHGQVDGVAGGVDLDVFHQLPAPWA